jgi:hypothetical protein
VIGLYELLGNSTTQLIEPASSTTKTGRHDIAEILLKVALNTKIQFNSILLTTLKKNMSLN